MSAFLLLLKTKTKTTYQKPLIFFSTIVVLSKQVALYNFAWFQNDNTKLSVFEALYVVKLLIPVSIVGSQNFLSILALSGECIYGKLFIGIRVPPTTIFFHVFPSSPTVTGQTTPLKIPHLKQIILFPLFLYSHPNPNDMNIPCPCIYFGINNWWTFGEKDETEITNYFFGLTSLLPLDGIAILNSKDCLPFLQRKILNFRIEF